MCEDQCPVCGHSLKFIWCGDNPNMGWATNLYACENCGAIEQQRIWKNKGSTIIDSQGEILKGNR